MLQARRRTEVLSTLFLLAAAVTLSGCSSADEPTKFEGPWAAEFAEHYERANDEYTKAVLSDGVITEQEIAETIDRLKACLDSSSITMTEYEFDGSYQTTFPPSLGNDKANDIVEGCSRTSGEALIGSLYTWVQRNPQHQDENQMIVDCLINEGAVAPGYRVEEFLADATADKFPFTVVEAAGRETLADCQADPLKLND